MVLRQCAAPIGVTASNPAVPVPGLSGSRPRGPAAAVQCGVPAAIGDLDSSRLGQRPVLSAVSGAQTANAGSESPTRQARTLGWQSGFSLRLTCGLRLGPGPGTDGRAAGSHPPAPKLDSDSDGFASGHWQPRWTEGPPSAPRSHCLLAGNFAFPPGPSASDSESEPYKYDLPVACRVICWLSNTLE